MLGFYKNILLGVIFSSSLSFSQNSESIQKMDSIASTVSTEKKTQTYASKVDSLWIIKLHKQLGIKENFAEMQAHFEDESKSKNYHFSDTLNVEVLRKRLESLDQKTPIKIEYNKSLENLIRYFLKKKYSLFQNMINLSQYYFPMIEEHLDKYNMPLELKYLVIIESALNPRAKSRVGASGLWQFMYSTGKIYHLEVSSFVDERYDPLKSTDAACRYLSDLYKIFGDWALALAAYNTGPGNVSKAMRRSGGYNNFWRLRRYMPRETSGYFPLFITSMYIFEYAKQYGLKVNKRYYHYQETDTITVKARMNFEQIARLTKTDSSQVAFLNPQYKLDAIPASQANPCKLRLPLNSVAYFLDNKEAIYKTLKKENIPLPIPPEFKGFASPDGIYIVKRGDSLWSIARLFPGVSAKDLIKWNRNVKNSSIKPGMRIKICSKC